MWHMPSWDLNMSLGYVGDRELNVRMVIVGLISCGKIVAWSYDVGLDMIIECISWMVFVRLNLRI